MSWFDLWRPFHNCECGSANYTFVTWQKWWCHISFVMWYYSYMFQCQNLYQYWDITPSGLHLYEIRDSDTGVFLWILQKFKNTFCIEHFLWLPLYIPSVKMPSRLRFTACNSWLGFSTRNSKIFYHFVFCIILSFCFKRISFSFTRWS